MDKNTVLENLRVQRNNMATLLLNHMDEIANLKGIIAEQAAEIEALKTAAPLADADSSQDRKEPL